MKKHHLAKGLSKKKSTVPKPVTDPPGKNASSTKSEGGIDLKKGYNVVGRPEVLGKARKA